MVVAPAITTDAPATGASLVRTSTRTVAPASCTSRLIARQTRHMLYSLDGVEIVDAELSADGDRPEVFRCQPSTVARVSFHLSIIRVMGVARASAPGTSVGVRGNASFVAPV